MKDQKVEWTVLKETKEIWQINEICGAGLGAGLKEAWQWQNYWNGKIWTWTIHVHVLCVYICNILRTKNVACHISKQRMLHPTVTAATPDGAPWGELRTAISRLPAIKPSVSAATPNGAPWGHSRQRKRGLTIDS